MIGWAKKIYLANAAHQVRSKHFSMTAANIADR
jgi:hypothetical protein